MGAALEKAFLDRVDPSEFPRDQLSLLQFPRGDWAPNGSPFPVKLETYLRMAKIPYQNVLGKRVSSKGKTPCIIYEGKEIADSQLIIEYLNKEKGVDLNAHLTEEQKAIAWAYQIMVEEHLYWVLVLSRWIYAFEEGAEGKVIAENIVKGAPSYLVSHTRSRLRAQTEAQGLGRHSKEDVMMLAERDVRSLSTFLGQKPFLMGDEPCQNDCAIFGLMAQFYWMCPGPMERLVKGDCRNIGDYCERMKERFWPDWDDCITHGGTKEATK